MRAVRLALVLAAAGAGGCNGGADAPGAGEPGPAVVIGGPAAPSADVSDLAAVLAAAATGDGRVDPAAIRGASDRLDAQLRVLAVSGPTATASLYPTYGAALAYWYNARAGWSMKLALLEGCPRQACPARLADRPLPLDGRLMSLAEIDRVLLAEAERSGDYRIAACAPGVRVDYGPMPTRPYTAADFGDRLAAMLSALVADPRRFVIDVPTRRVLIGPMLWARRQDAIDQYRRDYGGEEVSLVTALRPYVGDAARRRLEQAVGYEPVEAPRAGALAIPKRKVFFPGKIGRVEPP